MTSARACYVYAIVPRDALLPATIGAGPATGLALVPCRSLAAVTRWIDERPARVVDEVLHHELVVEAVRAVNPALPVRFGTVFRDAASVAAALDEHHELLAADLRRLGDKLEMSVTALWAASDAGAAGKVDIDEGGRRAARAGTQYLRTRAAEFRHEDALDARARTVARAVDAALGAVAHDRRESTRPTPRIALRAAYLLAPGDLDAFSAAFEAMRHTLGEVRVLMTGPWPPYSFVRRPGTEGGGRDARFIELAQRLADAVQERDG